jgi:lipopolysaccharide cholinephosphotransferase
VPDNIREQRKQGRKYFSCKRLLWIKKGYGENITHESMIQRLKYYGFRCVSILFEYEAIKRYYYNTQIRFNGIKTKKIVADGSYSFAKESIDREWVEKLEFIPFEKELFPAFVDRRKYLEHLYGDYMKLPPVEVRDRHQLKQVDFGRYSNGKETLGL